MQGQHRALALGEMGTAQPMYFHLEGSVQQVGGLAPRSASARPGSSWSAWEGAVLCLTSAKEKSCLQDKSPALLRILHSEPPFGPQPSFNPRPGFWGLLGSQVSHKGPLSYPAPGQ